MDADGSLQGCIHSVPWKVLSTAIKAHCSLHLLLDRLLTGGIADYSLFPLLISLLLRVIDLGCNIVDLNLSTIMINNSLYLGRIL